VIVLKKKISKEAEGGQRSRQRFFARIEEDSEDDVMFLRLILDPQCSA